jgi:unsaturated chondroitin disaccharide hydrolase
MQQVGTTLDWVQEVRRHAETKIYALADRLGGAFLHATVDGRYEPVEGDWWTSGFWPGMLWLVYRRNQDPKLAQWAIEGEDELERVLLDERFYGLHHDVGFQFQPTSVARYKLLGDPAGRRRGLLATALLMARFNPAGNFIEAWNTDDRRGMVIIDTMLNLPLLYWAAGEFNQPRYRNIADTHAAMAMNHFVRENGETHHIIRFDQVSGAPIEPLGGQGYAPYSCWSRGQSWALYGFTLAYRYTHNPAYLATARRVADSFLGALPSSLVPPWDFRAPDADTAPRDSSASAIAASGLLELATLMPNGEGEEYRQSAIKLMQALNEHCGTWSHPNEDGLLMHATGKLPNNRDVDVSLIYGDFYFLEALGKLDGITATCW